MNCRFPPEIEDKKLLAYLDDEVDQETRLHLEQCPYCLERAKELARVHNRLTARLYRLTCTLSLELGEYHLHILPASQVLVIAQHVRECPHCRRELAELEEFLVESDLQPDLLQTAKVLFARLVGGAGSTPSFGVLRGEAKGPITFEADGLVIILDIQATSEGRVSILGQVAADEQDQWTNAVVELRQADAPAKTTTVDD